MALTNAEKQAAWRERQRNRITELEAEVRRLNERIGQLEHGKVSNRAERDEKLKAWHDAFHSPEARAKRDAAVAKETAKLARLRQKMLKAHPDAGGSHDAFIKARAAYEKAKAGGY
jgi:hypothetical protein